MTSSADMLIKKNLEVLESEKIEDSIIASKPVTTIDSRNDVPWDRLIRFHKEICQRAEESFFSLPAGDSNSDRWSSLNQYEPLDLVGPWDLPMTSVVSEQLLSRLKVEGSLEVLLGGPCWFAWKKKNGGDWYLDWRPVLYREVRVELQDDHIRLVPIAGNWDISPLVFLLLEKQQVSSSAPLEESLKQIQENIQRLVNEGNSTTTSTLETLSAYSIELGNELRKARDDFPRQRVNRKPSQWILFTPPRAGSSSAYTQYILKDYRKLEGIFSENPNNCGGLGLLTGGHNAASVTAAEILPIISLNPSQLSAVEAIFKARPVTVISGPPGCGKSQVVLSLILNAWSQGISVLFASNNNQAVDVVRQRLETFESDIPIAIRAGAKRFNNIDESLRRSLNVISAIELNSVDLLPKLKRKQMELRQKRDAKRTFLESELPDRVDQAVGAAITAYASFKQLTDERDSQHGVLVDQLVELGYGLQPEVVQEELIVPFRSWINDTKFLSSQIEKDSRLRNDLSQKIIVARQLRDAACARVGLDSSATTSWVWLQNFHQIPNLLENWWTSFKKIIFDPIEHDLEPECWDKTFDNWSDAGTAEGWAKKTQEMGEEIRSTMDRIENRLTELSDFESSLTIATERLQEVAAVNSLPDDIHTVDNWMTEYSILCSLPVGKFDWLPWSFRSTITKNLVGIEAILRTIFPLSVWKKIGVVNGTSRVTLSEIMEVVQKWNFIRVQWKMTFDERAEFTQLFNGFRRRSRDFQFQTGQIPSNWNSEQWRNFATVLQQNSGTATKAAKAWRRRDARQRVLAKIENARAVFYSTASGAPIKEAWISGAGSTLTNLLEQLASNPSVERLIKARAEVYEEKPQILIDAWRQAADAEANALDVEQRLSEIPSSTDRIKTWQHEKPIIIVENEFSDGLPESGSIFIRHLHDCEEWYHRWSLFKVGSFTDLSKRIIQERIHSVEMIQEAIDMVPDPLRSAALIQLIDRLKAEPNTDWDVVRLRKGFEQFSPGKIRADLDNLEADLQSVSFQAAKFEWQKRVAGDAELQDAMRDLRTHYQRNRGEVQGNGVVLFEKVLQGQPIWITTALSGQSIPLKAGLFDLVVIDEATQCTLTNLLPLIYRAKRLVVIGDPEQLPAIGSIGLLAEQGLAEKYQISDWLSMLGHAENDTYKTSVSCLSRRQADVITLTEHYRSHPLIIGFSNQYIYRKSLRLRKDPSQEKMVPFGSGVVGINVAGSCSRFENSWANNAERDAVIELIQKIRSDPLGMDLSIGVVTPFRGQATAIEKKLEQLNLVGDVTVDTVHGYQGDERDVMIFSPVVSRGIISAAAKWVETPQNLINVAVTRAREALFFVADFNECRKQYGILGQFTRYVEKINLLRNTSSEELQLFGWIVMQGMMPEIHPKIRDIEVDFVLKNGGIRLVVEVDGDQHDSSTAQDAARDAFLVGAGYRVLRVKARDVRDAPAVVLARIGKALEAQQDAWDFAGIMDLKSEVPSLIEETD